MPSVRCTRCCNPGDRSHHRRGRVPTGSVQRIFLARLRTSGENAISRTPPIQRLAKPAVGAAFWLERCCHADARVAADGEVLVEGPPRQLIGVA